MRFKVGIPARYGSRRFPGKPLAMIGSKPMIQYVFEAAIASGADGVFIATDDERIADCADSFGAQVCMTARTHRSGSERLAEAAEILNLNDDEIVVNVQGDEPLIAPANIAQVALSLEAAESCSMSTLCSAVDSQADLRNPNVVKVVRDKQGRALYFSRACIPWPQSHRENKPSQPLSSGSWMRHIGIYACRAGFLKTYRDLPTCDIETLENLEQLRVLWHGYRIQVGLSTEPGFAGVDTPEDLERVRQIVERKPPIIERETR